MKARSVLLKQTVKMIAIHNAYQEDEKMLKLKMLWDIDVSFLVSLQEDYNNLSVLQSLPGDNSPGSEPSTQHCLKGEGYHFPSILTENSLLIYQICYLMGSDFTYVTMSDWRMFLLWFCFAVIFFSLNACKSTYVLQKNMLLIPLSFYHFLALTGSVALHFENISEILPPCLL